MTCYPLSSTCLDEQCGVIEGEIPDIEYVQNQRDSRWFSSFMSFTCA